MKKLNLISCLAALLLSGAALTQTALAQTPEPPPDAVAPLDTVTVYSEVERQADESTSRRTVRSVLAPVESLGLQYARWKQPVCFNVYGLSPLAKYVVERRLRDIAQQVGAPLDRDDPCIPNVTIVFTPDPQATLDSIARAKNYLVPWAGMIRSRLRESQPIQAWYSTVVRGSDGRRFLEYGAPDGRRFLQYDNDYDDDWRMSRVFGGAMTRINTGVETEIGTVTVLVDTKAIMGRSLGSLADHFALISLSQARVSRGCFGVDTIANLVHEGCDGAVAAEAITLGDLALLTGIYKTPDDRMQNLHAQRIIGNMREVLEAQLRDRERPANLDFER
jgi:hypothetical protein